MSESYEPPADPLGGPISRPFGDGLPPVDGALQPPGRGDSVDPRDGGDLGRDAGGMLGEG
jgi:hypothetical protein